MRTIGALVSARHRCRPRRTHRRHTTGGAMVEPLRREVLSQWQQAAHFLFDDEGADELPAEKVRVFMLVWMNGESPSKNYVVHRHSRPLTTEQRAAVIAEVFPDDQTYWLPGNPNPAQG